MHETIAPPILLMWCIVHTYVKDCRRESSAYSGLGKLFNGRLWDPSDSDLTVIYSPYESVIRYVPDCQESNTPRCCEPSFPMALSLSYGTGRISRAHVSCRILSRFALPAGATRNLWLFLRGRAGGTLHPVQQLRFGGTNDCPLSLSRLRWFCQDLRHGRR
jgi:hypothetical protein